MRRQLAGFTLMVFGLLALGLGFSVGPAPASVAAMPALQPSPRPTLIPTPDFRGDDHDYADPPAMGRITGTVIDIRTGAPAPGKRVLVGEVELLTDDSGNYDTWQAAGEYPLSLSLAEGEGTPAQGSTLVTLWGNDTVVVHLFFTSLAPAPAETATALPEPTPVPTAATVPGDLPGTSVEGRPADLPGTSVEGRPASPSGAALEKPGTLPVTGDELIDPQSLVLGGLALLALGASLMMLPRRAPARVGAPAPRPRPRRLSAQELLEELLRRDP